MPSVHMYVCVYVSHMVCETWYVSRAWYVKCETVEGPSTYQYRPYSSAGGGVVSCSPGGLYCLQLCRNIITS